MIKITCPSCGGEVKFLSKSSVFSICSYCHSTLVRNDLSIEAIGTMAPMPEDMSPLQIGSRGRFEGVGFEIVGRQRIGWDDGAWNEWYVFFEDGKDAWLADAQGFYMMSFEIKNFQKFPSVAHIVTGERVVIQSEAYLVEDIKKVRCVSSEGELPIRAVEGRISTSVDLVGPDKKFGTIDYGIDQNRLFIGKYIEFDQLKLLNLREIDGW